MVSKTIEDYKKRDEAARVVAELYGCSDRYVRLVLAGERTNEEIIAIYFDYIEGKNALIETIKKTIPLDGKGAKSTRMNPESWGSLPLFIDQNSSDSAV